MKTIDLADYRALGIAPRVVFDRLASHGERARFMLQRNNEWSPLSWNTFAALIRGASSFLAAHGLGPGDRAAILAPNGVPWLAAALAIQAAGGVMVPIYPSSTAEQIAYILQHSDAKVVFVGSRRLATALGEALSSLAAAGDNTVKTLDHVIAFDEAPTLPAGYGLHGWQDALDAGRHLHEAEPEAFMRRMDAIALEQPALMLYTSGTSGPPKGVPLTHMNVAVNGRDWLECNAPRLVEGGVDLLWLPMSHIFGFGEACLGNTLGWTSYLCEPAAVMELLPQVRPDVFMSVPSVWEKLATRAAQAADPDACLAAITGGRLHFCLSGGAGLKRSVKEFFHAHGILIIEGYGLTETSPTLTLNRPDAFRFDSVGRALPSVELRLADDGEIQARGASVFGGYHKDPVATAAAFTADGWLQTGDIGRFTEDGFLQIIDRKKDILVTAGGKNVPPANIELRFVNDPAIAHVVVYGDGQRYLVAGVWLTPEAAADAQAARVRVAERVAEVNAQLPSYETIKRFFIADLPLTLESGLLTPTLKVKRKQVYAAYRAQFERLYLEAAP